MDTDALRVGRVLRAVREQQGLTQLEVAVALGKGEGAYAAYESGRSRVVDIPDEAMPVLVAHLARLPASQQLVFPSPAARGPIRARSIQQWMQRLCKAAGVTPLPCHSSRHTYATLALDAGVPLKEVSEALGHASVATTARTYSHAAERQSKRRAAGALGMVLSGRTPTPIRADDTGIGTRQGR